MFPPRQAASSCWLAEISAGESHALSPSTARITYLFIEFPSYHLVPCRGSKEHGVVDKAVNLARNSRSHDLLVLGVREWWFSLVRPDQF